MRQYFKTGQDSLLPNPHIFMEHITRLVKIFPSFFEPHVLLPYTQDLANCVHAQADESTPSHPILFLYDANVKVLFRCFGHSLETIQIQGCL